MLVENWVIYFERAYCQPITDDFSYQPITGDVSFHATKMFYHRSCFRLFPWLPRRQWAGQPMKLRLVIYKRSLGATRNANALITELPLLYGLGLIIKPI